MADRAGLGVTKAQTLKHPTDMGAKITIDSASLMNKGLEVIEARWLFDVKAADIDVVVRTPSIVHSCVPFEDGSIKTQLGLPDMKLPSSMPPRPSPDACKTTFPGSRCRLCQPHLRGAGQGRSATSAGIRPRPGGVPCVLNAANEVAVAFPPDKWASWR